MNGSTLVPALLGAVFLSGFPVSPHAAEREPATGEQHWYRCNTHTHTASFPNSDANASPEFVARWYKTHGYQCLVISDHEHLTPVDFLNDELGADKSFLVIAGQEITQGLKDPSAPHGVRWSHVNGINTDKSIMPIGYPELATGISLTDTYLRNMDAVYAAGGIPQINHPNGIIGPRLSDLLPIQRPFLFEVWNAFPAIGSLGGADEAGLVIPSFESLWDSLLSHGKIVWAVASDDTHDYFNFEDRSAPTPGRAWIVLQAPELSLSAVLDALKKGRFYASTGPTLKIYHADSRGISIEIQPPLAWESTEKDQAVLYQTRFIGQNGKILAVAPGLKANYQFTGREQYVRASIVDSDGRRAWTQPVFLDARKSVDVAATMANSHETAAHPTTQPASPSIDENGTVHIPAMDVPYSKLASTEAKQNFLDTMRVRGLIGNPNKDQASDANQSWNIVDLRREVDDDMSKEVTLLRSMFPVTIKSAMIGGVAVEEIIPAPSAGSFHPDRVLVNLHGGGMLVGARYGGELEAIPIASVARTRVISVNYRMAPESHFPAASEDVASVYRELLKEYQPQQIGIFGCSSGAVLAAQSVAWFSAHGLPVPGAIGLFGEGAIADERTGDSDYVSAPLGGYPANSNFIQHAPPSFDYVAGTNPRSPMVSPAYDQEVLRSFPPSLLVSGTRDLGLSGILFTHEQLVSAGASTDLHVWEGAFHCAYIKGYPTVPEARQAMDVITRFFDRHLHP